MFGELVVSCMCLSIFIVEDTAGGEIVYTGYLEGEKKYFTFLFLSSFNLMASSELNKFDLLICC